MLGSCMTDCRLAAERENCSVAEASDQLELESALKQERRLAHLFVGVRVIEAASRARLIIL